jgi:hypothetical protein
MSRFLLGVMTACAAGAAALAAKRRRTDPANPHIHNDYYNPYAAVQPARRHR